MLLKCILFNVIARDGSRLLQKLSNDQRKAIVEKIASNLTEYSKDILEANKHDLEEAIKNGLIEILKFNFLE